MLSVCFIPMPIQKRAQELQNIIRKISDIDPAKNDRTRKTVAAKMIIAYQLRKEGVLIADIGRLLGKHHSTILYYLQRMDAVLSTPSYKAERELWEEFEKKL